MCVCVCVGAVGVVYRRPIIVYNPNVNVSLFVRDVYTTEGFLHLQTTTTATTTTAATAAAVENVWEVPPLSEKEIIRLEFDAKVPGMFSGYVHVKTDLDNMVSSSLCVSNECMLSVLLALLLWLLCWFSCVNICCCCCCFCCCCLFVCF